VARRLQDEVVSEVCLTSLEVRQSGAHEAFAFYSHSLGREKPYEGRNDIGSIESVRRPKDPDRFHQNDLTDPYSAGGNRAADDRFGSPDLVFIVIDEQANQDVCVNRFHASRPWLWPPPCLPPKSARRQAVALAGPPGVRRG